MNRKTIKSSHLFISTFILSTCISASDLGEGLVSEADSVLLKNQENKYTHWNGIGKILWNDTPMCTASLLDTRNSNNKATGPAYLLTSAHCIPGASSPKPDKPFEETVKFNYFNDTLNTSKRYSIKETLWQEYRDTDLAIMELDATLATLLKDGITPLQLSPASIKENRDILIVGIPEGLPEPGLRLAACTQEPTGADLIEGPRTYFTTFKNRCKEIRGGSSGSPVLDRKNGRIIGTLATSTYGATIEEQCFDNAPCEAKDGQAKWSPDTHYSHPAEHLSACFSEGVFTNVSNACTSTDAAFKVTDLEYMPTRYVAMPRNSTSPDPALSAEFSLSTLYYRFKTVRNAIDCRSPHNYSESISAKNATIKTPISRDPGMHYLCVIGVDSPEQTPDINLMKSAWIIPAQLIERLPVPLPKPTITLGADWNYTVKWDLLLPTHLNTLYYASSAKDIDCSKISIHDYIETYEKVVFKAEELPLTLCSRNQDLSLRFSKTRMDVLALP